MTSTHQRKGASKKSVSIEHNINRVGVSWRPRSNGKNYVVEMRPPTWHWRLSFGYYATKAEAMIARDYGALLRVSAGEDGSSAGGFNFNDHPSICEFEESHVIFKSIGTFESRCDEFRRLLALYPHQPKEKGADSPYKEFCNKARNDIAIAIPEFCKRNPQMFDNRRPATEVEKELQQVNESLDGRTPMTSPSSNFEVGSSYSSQSSMMTDNKEKLEQFVLGAHEHHKEHSPSGIATFNHSSPLEGKSGCVIRGFDFDSGFDKRSQETPSWIKENLNYKRKEDSKSLLQVQIANFKSPQPHQEEFKVQDDGVSTTVFSSSLRSSYESDNPLLESVGNQTFDQWMSTSATTYSGAPGSLSAGTSVDEETGLSSNNRNNFYHDLAQFKEQFAEGDGVHLQVANSSHIDMGAVARHDATCFVESNDQNEISDLRKLLDDLERGGECLTAMDIYEMVNVDIPVHSNISVPSESNCAPSHTLSMPSNPISEVVRTMSKVEATDERFKGTTSAKGYSTLSAYEEAVLAAQLESERVKLDIMVQQNKKLKIENLSMAKDGGVVSNEEYIQHVKALLNL